VSPNWVRRLGLLNVIVNVVIVITGGAVRLTGSGLGCPSWPNCAPGMFHATAEMGVHGAIEWGNRLFGSVVALVAIVTFIAAVWRKPRRTSLVWLTAIVGVAVAAQAAIGAFTVNTGLAPWLVSVHFLVSVGILTAAYAAWRRAGEPDGRARLVVPVMIRRLWWLLAAVALTAILIGTVVTGSGPHAGDPDAVRLGVDSELAAQLHADAVFLLLGLSVALVFAMHAVSAPARACRAAWLLVAVEGAQGAIGLVQYFTGLPVLLVGAHMLGAALLWLAVLVVGFTLRRREPVSLAHVPKQSVLVLNGDEDDAEFYDEDDETITGDTAPAAGEPDTTTRASHEQQAASTTP
jgi:cytochrome c oxidase assembly protein subunit 15